MALPSGESDGKTPKPPACSMVAMVLRDDDVGGVDGDDAVGALAELADHELLAVSLDLLECGDGAAAHVVDGEVAAGDGGDEGAAGERRFCGRGEHADDQHRPFTLPAWRLPGRKRTER